jgi:hypothetical protein
LKLLDYKDPSTRPFTILPHHTTTAPPLHHNFKRNSTPNNKHFTSLESTNNKSVKMPFGWGKLSALVFSRDNILTLTFTR